MKNGPIWECASFLQLKLKLNSTYMHKQFEKSKSFVSILKASW